MQNTVFYWDYDDRFKPRCMQDSLEVEAGRFHDDHSMPLHGPKLEALDPFTDVDVVRTKLRGVSSRVVACYHDDQLVRSGASRCQPSHRVLGALELVAVADENQAIRRLVWGREGRKGRSKGNEEEQSHFVQRLSSHTSLLQDAAGLLSPERELPCKSIAVHRLSRSQYTSTQSAGVSTRRAVA